MESSTGIVGYCQPLEISTGESTDLKLSSNSSKICSVEIMRIICADIDPNGPGQQFELQKWGAQKRVNVSKQDINLGSYGIVETSLFPTPESQISIEMYIWPTKSSDNTQSIFNWGELNLVINPNNILTFCFDDSEVCINQPLLLRNWYFIRGTVDITTKAISVEMQMLKPITGHLSSCNSTSVISSTKSLIFKTPMIFGAKFKRLNKEQNFTCDHFNGKIEAPVIVMDNDPAATISWDFSKEINKPSVVSNQRNRFDIELINCPLRGATGYNWNGSVDSWTENPDLYGAIHFHDDDITDCKWQTNLKISPPKNTQSGYYIARVRTKGILSDIPFFVTQRLKKSNKKILFLAPTATYKAYANTHVKFDSHNTENLFEAPISLSEDELYLNKHRELGLSNYDTHSDESGVVYVSERRPILNNRPGLYTFNYINDTHIIKWLEEKGYDYEVVTDEDLHNFGYDVLKNYSVVITASHPEYYSTQMWDALSKYQNNGGRHMYLGGNGFYWRIAFSDHYPGVMEHRRGVSGVRTWEGEPGEHHLSFTGEPGGLWRTYGRAPQSLVGNGFSSTLFVKSTWFRRSTASYSKETDFIFKDLNTDIIGDFGYRGGGCVGLEIDRWDRDLGSPENSIVVATSEYVGAGGLLTGEEFITTTRALDGVQNGRVRADMVFFTIPNGGAVWSTGSIAWATSLLWAGTDNSVSKVTQNVLDRFLDETEFETDE